MAKLKYQALAASLRAEIIQGDLKAGDKLNTEKELMERFAVSRQTVRNAVSLLEQEGYVCARQGSGTFVCPARQPASQKIHQVAVITSHITSYIFPAVTQGIETVLRENGYSLLLKATNNQVNLERSLLMSLLESPPSGLIIEGSKTALPNPNLTYYKKLRDQNVPIIFIHSNHPELSSFVHVLTDDRQGGYDAVSYLARRGHRRIAGIFKSTDIQGLNRYAGYLDGIISCNLNYSDQHLLWFQDNEQLELLFRDDDTLSYFQDCSAIVCYNDQVAYILLKFLSSHGFQVPQDISLISFDDSHFASYTQPALTSFAHPKAALGSLAAEKLIRMIDGHPEESVVMPLRLVERESTADLFLIPHG